ncbi:hypothetical protein GW17_00059357, partial [Ensete ventricosum]
RRGGSGCVVATTVVSGGCAWPRKDSDGRWEEAAGASTFGATAAAGEMGIWWPATAARRRGIEVVDGVRGDRRRGQRRCAAATIGEERKRAGSR